MKSKILSVLSAAVLVLTLGSLAKADTVTQGGIIYTYSASQDGSDAANVFDVTLVADTSGAVQSGTFFSFAVQFTGASDVTLESAPSGTWTVLGQGPNNPTGCNINGAANQWCAQDSAGGYAVPGGVYTFVFDVTMPDGTPLPSTTHLQAFQGQGALAISCSGIGVTGPSQNLDGCDASQIPEPGSLMLFGTGLLGLAGFIRRKLSA